MLINAASACAVHSLASDSAAGHSAVELSSSFDLATCLPLQSETSLIYEEDGIAELCNEQQGELLSVSGGLVHDCPGSQTENGEAVTVSDLVIPESVAARVSASEVLDGSGSGLYGAYFWNGLC